MRKIVLFALLFVATAMFAEVRVETFDTKDGTATNTYVTSVTTKECQQASWTFFSGGILKNLGNMGNTNFAAVIRAKKKGETVTPYIYSDSIPDGIDSLWFDWNSNGNETPFGNWNVKIYVNDSLVGNITDKGAAKKASAPFYSFNAGGLNIEGKFVIKFVNESYYDTTANYMRFVFDNLSWTTHGSAPVKQKPTFEFAEDLLVEKINVIAFSNTLTNTSDATPVFESSNPAVATVAANGSVTIVGLGTTVITASVAETDTYKAAEASYTLRVVPLKFNMETFDGAANITSGSSYYITKDSVCPASTATGIVWTTYLGSIRNTMASWPAANIAACVRAKKSTEPKFGYLKSSTIGGGIDSLAFDWNSNGDESTRKQNWNIVIYINGDSVGAITDKPAAKQTAGNEFRYTLGNLKIDGDFVLEIMNKDTAEADGNQFRWAMDNLEWYSYEAPCENNYGILVDSTDYIAGEYDAVKNEVKVVTHLDKDQEVALYNKCAETTFTATQEEGGYWFTVVEGKWYAPSVGTYTIYIKLNPGNDVVWTAYEAPKYEVTIADVENGTLVVKVGGDTIKTGDSIAANTLLTIIPAPAEGYKLDSVTANGEKVTPQEDVYTYSMGYENLTISAVFEEVCEGEFGIMVDDSIYIAGVKNTAQTSWAEYTITAALNQDQTLVFYDNCNKASFLATQEEGCYWFTYDSEKNVFVAPATGTYTIYLKMYGPDNNAIWTEFEATTGIENTAVKADVRKAIEDGMVIIYRNGKRYNLTGAQIR